MALLLVNGQVIKSYYMGSTESSSETHIIEADDEEQAEKAFRAFYETLSSRYSVEYRVINLNASKSLNAKEILEECAKRQKELDDTGW